MKFTPYVIIDWRLLKSQIPNSKYYCNSITKDEFIFDFPWIYSKSGNLLNLYYFGDRRRFRRYWSHLEEFMKDESFCDEHLDLMNWMKKTEPDRVTLLHRILEAHEPALLMCGSHFMFFDYFEYLIQFNEKYELGVDWEKWLRSPDAQTWYSEFLERVPERVFTLKRLMPMDAELLSKFEDF